MLLQSLKNKHLHHQVYKLALPMVLSNITVPLLGLVDAAVIGHLDHAWYLGGVALGNTILTVAFFLLGFLRMSTTGLNAQAYGANNKQRQVSILLQGFMIAFGLSLILLLIHIFFTELIFNFSAASKQVNQYALQYFSIRIYASPAVLANMVTIGWLLGNQNAKGPMWLLIISNLINIILDFYFVLGLNMQVKGVAIASNIADYSAFALGLYFIKRQWQSLKLPAISNISSLLFYNINHFITLNRDIFIRSLCLQLVFAFMTIHGASLGDNILAANAILLSLLMLISYAMDGCAYSMEALVGKCIGTKDINSLKSILIVTTFWGVIISCMLTILFAVGGTWLISVISSIPIVQQQAARFLPWLIAFPLVSMWCFLLDGIFIGATRAKEMRNSMFLASISFFLIWIMFNQHGNHALWAAMLMFMFVRALTLGTTFIKLWHKNLLIV